jgi:hypothetical protein
MCPVGDGVRARSSGHATEMVGRLFKDSAEAPLFGVLQTIAGVEHASVEALLVPLILQDP